MSDESSPLKPQAEKPLEFNDDQSVPEQPSEQPDKATDESPKSVSQKAPKGNKWMIFVLILLLLGALGVGVWYVFLGSDDQADNTATDETSQQANSADVVAPSQVASNYELDQIIYAFGVSFDSKAEVFSRAVGGGERQSLFDLTKIGSIDWGGLGSADSFVQSEKYAFVIDSQDIYVGEPGEAPQKVYTHPDANADQGIGIQSVVISPDGSQLAFSALPTGIASPQVWTLGADGNNAKMLIDDAKIGPLQWSSDNTKLVLGPNILGAGARLDNPQVVEVSTGNVVVALQPATPHELVSFAFNADATKFAYIKATIDQSRTTDDIIGYYVGKPYEVHWVDLTTGNDTKVATVDKNDGPSSLMWQHGEDSFLYSAGSVITKIDVASGNSTEIYDTTQGSVDVLYAADSEMALYGSLQNDQTFTIFSVDLDAKDRTQVMQTTDATVGVGIIIK